MDGNDRDVTQAPEGTDDAAPKAPWHAPTMEQVEYSATEAAGVGAVYDLVVYTGSL